MIPGSAKISRNPQVVYRDLEDGQGGVLLHLESGQYHGLNQIGAAIWDLLDGTRTSADVQSALRARVEDPPDHLEGDIAQFLEGLHERGLIILASA
jgi:hypothetical protein